MSTNTLFIRTNTSNQSLSFEKTEAITHQMDDCPRPTQNLSLKERIITKIDAYDHRYVDTLRVPRPFSWLQHNADLCAQEITKCMNKLLKKCCLHDFNKFLDAKNKGDWLQQLFLFVVKLPFRSARAIIHMIFNIIATTLNTLVHPVKSLVKLVKLLIIFLDEIRKPEVWSKIGAGMLGASFGQSCVGNPLSIPGAIIGACLIFCGISIGSLIAAIEAYKDAKKTGSPFPFSIAGNASWNNFQNQARSIPESMCTGFLMGLMIGAIQKSIRAKEQKQLDQQASANKQEAYDRKMAEYNSNKIEILKEYADKYLKAQNLPKPTNFGVDSNGNIHLVWKGKELQQIFQSNNKFEFLMRCDGSRFEFKQVIVEIHPGNRDWALCTADAKYGYPYPEYSFQYFGKDAVHPIDDILSSVKPLGIAKQVVPLPDHITPAVCGQHPLIQPTTHK